MSTESNDQYRAGFEAWARDKHPSLSLEGERLQCGRWHYYDGITRDWWQVWCAAMQQREASTEPSAPRVTVEMFQSLEAANKLLAESQEQRRAREHRFAAAGALSDDAKLLKNHEDSIRLLTAGLGAVASAIGQETVQRVKNAFAREQAVIDAEIEAHKTGSGKGER